MPEVGDLVTHIRVVNRNPFPIIDRYDSVEYHFNPMERVTIAAEVATHIFGYRPDATEEDMFSHVQRRFGWNTLEMRQSEQDRAYFDKIDIKPVVFELVEREVLDDGEPKQVDAPVPRPMLRRAKRGRPKKVRLRPPVSDEPMANVGDDQPPLG